MATNIPPHNLREIVDATIALIKNPHITVDELMEIVPGPDFPTGGHHLRARAASARPTRRAAARSWCGPRPTIEEHPKTGRKSIVATEIPYQVNKAKLIEKIAELVRDKKIDGISDIRDESDRDGMRIVIDLKKDAVPEVVLNNLWKMTPAAGLVRRQHAGHRRRAARDAVAQAGAAALHRTTGARWSPGARCSTCAQARERMHILEGLKIAVDNIDAVIDLIRVVEGHRRPPSAA